MREWLTNALLGALKDLVLAAGILLALLQGAVALIG